MESIILIQKLTLAKNCNYSTIACFSREKQREPWDYKRSKGNCVVIVPIDLNTNAKLRVSKYGFTGVVLHQIASMHCAQLAWAKWRHVHRRESLACWNFPNASDLLRFSPHLTFAWNMKVHPDFWLVRALGNSEMLRGRMDRVAKDSRNKMNGLAESHIVTQLMHKFYHK